VCICEDTISARGFPCIDHCARTRPLRFFASRRCRVEAAYPKLPSLLFHCYSDPQLEACLEANYALEVRRGHGPGHVNFYRILREEDGLPVPHRKEKKVKSQPPFPAEKVKFWAPPEPEKVKSEPPKSLKSWKQVLAKVVDTKEREKKEAPAPCFLSPQDGADAPENTIISPEVMRKFGLRYGTEEWPPPRRKD
jgi:hypothetical protein